ncbi:YciI family protein [Heyndrickxia acidicola]|uniref:YciI family protein n=1 Tax=Heyndrickxia acidicola TaxID=209389 RepID=A0ABU6MI56_9BACI|nr:YciI family protein [Heyndrickxia acidicola]MED1203691.1 YciI family protein [Heyndrickxia acidicola]
MSDNTLEKKHFLLKIITTRTTFSQDMTEEERNIMGQHVGYWTDKQNQGIAVVFGPVLNPSDPHGIVIVEVENAEQVPTLIAEDPGVIAGILKTEFYPMKAVLRK